MSYLSFQRKRQRIITGSTIVFILLSIFFFILGWASANQNGFMNTFHIMISIIGLVISIHVARQIFIKTSMKARKGFGSQSIVIGGLVGLVFFLVLIFQLILMEEGLDKIQLDPALMNLIGLFFGFLSLASIAANFSRKTHRALYSMDIIGAKKFIAQFDRHKRHK